MGIFDNFFKKDEDDRKASYKPSSDATKAVEAKGSGKASGKNIEKPEGGFTDDQMTRINRSRQDSNWGYYDPNTGNYVPWYIDIQDGGGKNQSGDTFEGAGLYSMVANAAGVAPYGYNRPRTYARAGMLGRPELPSAVTPRPTGGGVSDAAVTPVVDYSPYGDAGFYEGMEVNRPVAPEYRSMDQAVGGYQYPSMYRPMNRQVGLFQEGQASPSPNLSRGTTIGVAQIADSRLKRQQSEGNRPVPPLGIDPAMMGEVNTSIDLLRTNQPNLPSPATLTATRPSTAGMTPPIEQQRLARDQSTAFNQAMSTVPQMLQGTQIEQMYRDYLLAGNRGTFAQFTGAQ